MLLHALIHVTSCLVSSGSWQWLHCIERHFDVSAEEQEKNRRTEMSGSEDQRSRTLGGQRNRGSYVQGLGGRRGRTEV